ncbi:MAG: hypothetical protein ABFD77_11100 [Thermotogota bacterium]
MKKFLEIVKRQTVLASKAASGKATKEELEELSKLNKAVEAATSAPKVAKTKLTTMTLAKYREWHDTTMKQIEAGDSDADLLAVVKRNLAAVKEQAKTKSDDIVAVELPVEKTEDEKYTALMDRIAALEEKLSEKDNATEPAGGKKPDGGDAPATGEGDKSNKADKPVSQALAMEAVDALLARYTKLKASVDSGSLTKQDLESLWSDYELKRAIEQAAAIMAKSEKLAEMAEAVLPGLKKLAAAEDDKGGEGEGGKDGEGDGDGDAGDDAGDGTNKGKDSTNKGSGAKTPSRWESGLDLAPTATAKQQAAAIKRNKDKNGR